MFIALVLEESLLQLKPVSLVDFSSGMVVGRARTPRMATLRTILIIGYQSQNLWDSDLCFIVKLLFFRFKPCPAGREGSIHGAGVFPQFLPQRARKGSAILWMVPGSLSG